jgi:hydrogenase maturation protease
MSELANPALEEGRRPVLLLGLGNPLFGDDGVGPAVVEGLLEQDLPPEVEVLDGGTAGLGLLDTIAGRRLVVVVDAAEMGRPAGTVARLTPDQATLLGDQAPLSPHQLGLAEVLALAERLEMAPTRVVIWAVQPAFLGWKYGLSPEVEASLPGLVVAVLQEVGRIAEVDDF